MAIAIRRGLPWVTLWAVLAVALCIYFRRGREGPRHVAAAATATITGRVLREAEEKHQWILVKYGEFKGFFRKDAGPASFRELKVGSELPVYYSPTNPGVATLEDPRVELRRARNQIASAIAIAAGLAFALWCIRQALRAAPAPPARAG
jgi:hypothetical protein